MKNKEFEDLISRKAVLQYAIKTTTQIITLWEHRVELDKINQRLEEFSDKNYHPCPGHDIYDDENIEWDHPDYDRGGTGHGDDSLSDADPGL